MSALVVIEHMCAHKPLASLVRVDEQTLRVKGSAAQPLHVGMGRSPAPHDLTYVLVTAVETVWRRR